MVDDLGVGSNETELDKIFEEKLYVNKRHPLAERNASIADINGTQLPKKENIMAAKTQAVKTQDSDMLRNVPLDREKENYTGTLPFLHGEDAVGLDYAKDAGLFNKEASLEGIYNDGELDAYREPCLASGDKRVTFESGVPGEPGKGSILHTASHANETAGDSVDWLRYKEKVRRLEIEFNKMVRAHKDTIKMRSKLYRFIYSEIAAIQDEFIERTTLLERENARLKQELELAEKRLESYKAHTKAYHRALMEKIYAWKGSLEKQVCEYLLKRAR